MKFGIVASNQEKYCDLKTLEKAVSEAETHSFDSFLLWDHYMLPDGNQTHDPFILLSFLVAKTAKIRLGTCVTPIPMRPPAVLAKMTSTLDILSNGRVILGVGAGWYAQEFRAYSEWDNDLTRVEKTREGLELMTRLWTQDKVNYNGQYYHAVDAVLEPKSVQKPYPELWFGTSGTKMLEMAAKYGAGWIPVNVTATEYKQGKTRINENLRKLKRRNKLTLAYFGDPEKTSKQTVKTIENYKEAGCQYFAVAWLHPREKFVAEIKKFADDVMVSF